MSPDNSANHANDLKRTPRQVHQLNCCRGSGLPPLPPTNTSNTTVVHSQNAMSSLIPRPFPPPALAGVPMEYIIDQLRGLAHHYWDKSETADCTIIVPIPHYHKMPMHPAVSPPSPTTTLSSCSNASNPSVLGRRATEPNLRHVPQMTLNLHIDYLSAHSRYLRGLFGGASPFDLLNADHSPRVSDASEPRQTRFTVPPERFPRIMPSPPNHPILYLPVPDPSSFQLLVHWMYFGETAVIEDSLYRGLIQWEGIARNVEYLGLSKDIKVFLGNWYNRWLEPERRRRSESPGAMQVDDEERSSVPTSSPGYHNDDDDDEPSRGRTRTRPLSLQHAPKVEGS